MRFERPCTVWEALEFWAAWKEALEGGPGRELGARVRAGKKIAGGRLGRPWALKGPEALGAGALGWSS